MPDASQPQSGLKNTAGYRPLVPVDFSRGMGSSAFACVAAAAGIGMAVGVAMAFNAGRAAAPAAPRVSDALQTHSSGFDPLPVVYAASNPSLLGTVDPGKAAGFGNKPTAASLKMPVSDKTSAAKPMVRHKHHARHGWAKKFLGKLTGKAKRKPYVSETTVATADQTALDKANAAAACRDLSFWGSKATLRLRATSPPREPFRPTRGRRIFWRRTLPELVRSTGRTTPSMSTTAATRSVTAH